MKFTIAHRLQGRIRLHLGRYAFTAQEAIAMQTQLTAHEQIVNAEVSGITGSVLLYYSGDVETVLLYVRAMKKAELTIPEDTHAVLSMSSEKFVIDITKKVAFRYLLRPWLPAPLGMLMTFVRSVSYFKKAYHRIFYDRKIAVEVLDAAAIGSSMIQGDFGTAGSIMFLLSISESIEEYCKKRAKANLANNLALHIDHVWIVENGTEKLIHSSALQIGNHVVVRTGHAIPIDGKVVSGEAMVNQASMTGEPLPIVRDAGKTVYAGTVVEEGTITVETTALRSDTRINKIMKMIDESEEYKATLQSKNERLADSIVPFSFLGASLVYLFTRNFAKATSIFFVDYSCAIKLSTSLSILGGLNEASKHKMFIKGGRFLEELAEADTIIFDKTGTLTVASPMVKDVIPFGGYSRDEVLKISACLEEHFPHSVAQAVVEKARQEGIEHQENHAEVEYVIAHGVASKLDGKRVLIGSEHFIFDDEETKRGSAEMDFLANNIHEESVLYLAIDSELAGIILIDDPIRETSAAVIKKMQALGLNVVMLTGDSEKTAGAVAKKLGIDAYRSQVLPEEKVAYIQNLKSQGHKVIMVGDGVNDAPALSAAHVSVSMKDSSDIAKSVADITLLSQDLNELANAIALGTALMKRIKNNYRFIITFNTMLIGLGFTQTITAATSALLHNAATVGVGAASVRPLLK